MATKACKGTNPTVWQIKAAFTILVSVLKEKHIGTETKPRVFTEVVVIRVIRNVIRINKIAILGVKNLKSAVTTDKSNFSVISERDGRSSPSEFTLEE